MKKLALLLLFLLAAPLHAGWIRGPYVAARPLGYAVHTPNVLTTLATTPDAGVVIPDTTRTITCTVKNFPVNYFHGSTSPTSTLGLTLDVGTWSLVNDTRLIAGFKFIDTTAGASTVTCEFYGE